MKENGKKENIMGKVPNYYRMGSYTKECGMKDS